MKGSGRFQGLLLASERILPLQTILYECFGFGVFTFGV